MGKALGEIDKAALAAEEERSAAGLLRFVYDKYPPKHL